MDLKVYTTIYIISNFFTIFIINRFVRTFLQEYNYSKLISCIAHLFYFLVTALLYLLIDIPILTLLSNWILIFTILLTYKSTFQKRIIYTTYILMFMLFPELLIGAFTGYFKFSFFSDGNYSDSLGIIITKIFTYTEALLLYNYKSRKENKNVSINLFLVSVTVPALTLSYEIMFVNNSGITQSKVIISVVILFIINITVFYLYDSLSRNYIRQQKLYILKTENELYSKQCEIMQSSTKELQSFRHDMNNQFIALSELFESQDYNGAKKQLNSLINLTKIKILYSSSGNVIIDGLINYKLQNVQNNNIIVKTEITIPSELPFATADIVTVLGNLIDNALDALQNVSPENRSLYLKISFSQQKLIIKISNSYNGNIISKGRKIKTSKNDPKNHGYGLNNISKTINKYHGYMEIDYSNSIFTVDIIMYA